MTYPRTKLAGPVDDTPAAASVTLTPTWAGLMPVLILALENGTLDGKRMARAELTRLAKEIDAANAATAKAKAATLPPAPTGQPAPTHVFNVAFTVPAEELESYGEAWGKRDMPEGWPANPAAQFATMLQADLYDDCGLSGHFEVTGHETTAAHAADAIAFFESK